jgi:hypothetical protein
MGCLPHIQIGATACGATREGPPSTIYDFNTQLHEPVDRVKVSELPARHSALNFLFARQFAPVFGNNRVAVTRKAAQSVADAFNSIRGGRDVCSPSKARW